MTSRRVITEYKKVGVNITTSKDHTSMIQLLAAGETVSSIASGWGVRYISMKSRVRRLRELAGVETNCELVAKAIREGWID
jgi:DNA-binding NarL/FixJ family response regulator